MALLDTLWRTLTKERKGVVALSPGRASGCVVVWWWTLLCIIFAIEWKSRAIPLNHCTHTHGVPWQASEHEAGVPLKERLNQCPPVLPATKTALKAEPLS